MPGNNLPPGVLKKARAAFKACRPTDRVACQDFGMQQDDILDQQIEAALTAGLAAMWRPISEAEPNQTYLLGWRDWRDHAWCMEVAPAIHGKRFESGFSSVSHHGSATHFMPLPSQPAKEG